MEDVDSFGGDKYYYYRYCIIDERLKEEYDNFRF
jgi:hypothetical protein